VVISWHKDGKVMEHHTALELFNSVPKQDVLALFPPRSTDYQKVAKLLDFKKKDVARASNLAVDSVRYDPRKMPKILEVRMREWAVALGLVAQFFKDEKKTVLWFKTPNPLLGDVSPREMIRVGKFNKLLSFIQNALAENERDR
jgi:hypothetical protein